MRATKAVTDKGSSLQLPGETAGVGAEGNGVKDLSELCIQCLMSALAWQRGMLIIQPLLVMESGIRAVFGLFRET